MIFEPSCLCFRSSDFSCFSRTMRKPSPTSEPNPLPCNALSARPLGAPLFTAHKHQDKEASPVTEATATESSTAIVKSEGTAKDKGVEGFNESDIIYADDEVPFGPLGVFPETYTELQAKVGIWSEWRERARDSSSAVLADHAWTRLVIALSQHLCDHGPLFSRCWDYSSNLEYTSYCCSAMKQQQRHLFSVSFFSLSPGRSIPCCCLLSSLGRVRIDRG